MSKRILNHLYSNDPTALRELHNYPCVSCTICTAVSHMQHIVGWSHSCNVQNFDCDTNCFSQYRYFQFFYVHWPDPNGVSRLRLSWVVRGVLWRIWESTMKCQFADLLRFLRLTRDAANLEEFVNGNEEISILLLSKAVAKNNSKNSLIRKVLRDHVSKSWHESLFATYTKQWNWNVVKAGFRRQIL